MNLNMRLLTLFFFFLDLLAMRHVLFMGSLGLLVIKDQWIAVTIDSLRFNESQVVVSIDLDQGILIIYVSLNI